MRVEFKWNRSTHSKIKKFDMKEIMTRAYKCQWNVTDNGCGDYSGYLKTTNTKTKYQNLTDKINNIFIPNAKYQSDIDKVKLHYTLYIKKLFREAKLSLIFSMQNNTIPKEFINFVGALSLSKVRVTDKKTMRQRKFKKVFEENLIEKNHIYSETPNTKIEIENPLMLMGYYEEDRRTIYLCHENIIEVSKELSLVVPECIAIKSESLASASSASGVSLKSSPYTIFACLSIFSNASQKRS